MIAQIALICSWLGTLVLVSRGLPQAIKSIRDGNSEGLSPHMLWLWLLGSFLVIPNLLVTYNLALIMVYLANIIVILIMLKYFYFPRKEKK